MKVVLRAACALLFVFPFFLLSSQSQGQVTAVAPVTLQPQYNHRWEVYGGGQYSHFNPSPGPNIHANNLVGWNGSAIVYLHPIWGLEASARGLYGTMSIPQNAYGIPASPKMSEDLFLFGPNFRLFRGDRYAAGLHFLIGAAYGSFDKDFPAGIQPNAVNIYNNKLAFGSAIGWWTDYNLSPRLAIRGIADYQPTRYGYSLQSEFAGSLGVVFKFGTLKK